MPSKSPTPSNARFLRDGRLQLEDGTRLDAGQPISNGEAGAAAKRMRVFVHNYPRTTEITDDSTQIATIVARVTRDLLLFEYSARVYSGENRVALVLEYLH